MPPPRRSDKELVAAALKGLSPRPNGLIHQDILPPPETFPGYDVVREIHRGGQGVVYQAIQKTTKRKVAIKVMHEGAFAGSRGRARFDREVEILAQLDHPNIVSIIDSGVAGAVGDATGAGGIGGSHFYVMDYISGQTLDAYFGKTGKGTEKPIQETLALFAKICDAVNAAHLKGITHRDLKPSNIRIDHFGEPHVLDFGLAKIATGEVTDDGGSSQMRMMSMTGQFIGSLPWASPEQAEGVPGKVDLRTDVYSLGVILYQMLTGGRFPYQVVGNMRDVMDNILRAEPARPSTIRRQINDEVETIVLKSLNKERERRYQSAGELARDVKRYLGGEPIEAMRDSGWYVLSKTLRRYKAQVGVVATVLALIVVFGIVSFVLYRQAAAARLAELGLRTRYEHTTEAGRTLARKNIFEFNNKIKDLRGSTGARQALLSEALAYLKGFEDEFGQDPRYQAELADSYLGLGDIQTGLYLPKVGTLSAGMESYRRAYELRTKVLATDPKSPAPRAALAQVQYKIADAEYQGRKFEDARKDYNESFNSFVALLAEPGLTPAQRAEFEEGKQFAAHGLADTAVRTAAGEADSAKAERIIADADALYQQATAYWQGRVDANSTDDWAARNLGVSHDKQAKARMTLGDIAKRNADIAGDARKDKDAAARLYADAWIRYSEMMPYAQSARDLFTRLSEANPHNALFRRDLWLAHHNIGVSLMSRGQVLEKIQRGGLKPPAGAEQGAGGELSAQIAQLHESALAEFVAALRIAEELGASDAANLEAQRDIAVCLNKVGNEQRDLSLSRNDPRLLAEAEKTFEASLKLREGMLKADPMQRHRRDLALGLFKLGDVKDRGGDRHSAKGLYEACIGEFETLVREGVARPEEELKEAKDAIAKLLAAPPG